LTIVPREEKKHERRKRKMFKDNQTPFPDTPKGKIPEPQKKRTGDAGGGPKNESGNRLRPNRGAKKSTEEGSKIQDEDQPRSMDTRS